MTDALAPLAELLRIMARLRDPDSGCPWDLEQDFASIAPYTIEEAYEVADAIARGDIDGLRDELGDLLLQVVFHARMAEEAGHFAFPDVAAAINDKMLRRHPHVFGDTDIADHRALKEAWETHKARERADVDAHSQMDGVARALPALLRAQKLQKRAARVGFDWPDSSGAIHKTEEELGELREALAKGDQAHIEEELGDLFFALVNVGRLLGCDSEQVLRAANDKFERRFRALEAMLGETFGGLAGLPLEVMDEAWEQVKLQERKTAATE